MLDRIMRKLDRLEEGRAVPRYASIATLAEAYEVSDDTIRRACDRRELRYTQVTAGGAKRIAIADFAKWLERHTVQALAR
jgi:excisionase family DNA binding protein